MELSSIELGAEIKRLRKSNFLSQQELAEGICCQTTISSVEKGKSFPSVEVLHYICKRLNVSMDYFFRDFNIDSEYYVKETVDNIEMLLKQKKYEEILEITEFERKLRNKRNLGEQFNQYIDWHHFRAAQLQGNISWKECVEELEGLVKHKGIHKLQFQDLKIKNVIANVLAENNQGKKALTLYSHLLKVEIDLEEYSRLKLKVYFNLSKLYFYEEMYAQSIKTAEEGIKVSISMGDMNMLGNLYLQAAQSMIVLKHKKSMIIDYLEKAKSIYKILNKQWHYDFVEELEVTVKSEE